MKGVIAAMMLVVLCMAQVSYEQTSRKILRYPLNQEDYPFIGLILETKTDEDNLIKSGLYVPDSSSPSVTIKGRIFHIGKLNGVKIIYVKTDGGVISTTSSAQLLVDSFEIEGIVHYGTVGSANNSLHIGDVVSPSHAAYYANVLWQRRKSKIFDIKFGDYNLPHPGENGLGGFVFKPTKVFDSSGNTEKILWLPFNSTWPPIANGIEVELEDCLPSGECLPRKPVIVNGLRAGTADVYMNNTAMREFMYSKFKISTVDTTTATIVWVALVNNNLPVVAFKGVSNAAGGRDKYPEFWPLGSFNAFKAAVAFIEVVGKSRPRLIANSY